MSDVTKECLFVGGEGVGLSRNREGEVGAGWLIHAHLLSKQSQS